MLSPAVRDGWTDSTIEQAGVDAFCEHAILIDGEHRLDAARAQGMTG